MRLSIAEPMWRTAWQVIFVGSNILLAILIGTALGNVVRGVPFSASGKFALAFFTNFSPYGNAGILDWFTVTCAVFILVTFAAHGANALVRKPKARCMTAAGVAHDDYGTLYCCCWRWSLLKCGACDRNYFPA